ncbi:MAG TPA: DUF882 domain-containing protein [Polyangiaceae bacterium]|nr:DUF882 domain-containing protein [Polyangiaceae bacterium]
MRSLVIASFVLASVLGLSLGSAQSSPEATFAGLPALRFSNQSTGQSALVRLYDDVGHVDEREASRLDALLADTRDPKNCEQINLGRRTLQLAVRAALHFHVREVQVVSAYRKPGRRREGPHASGKAIDFKLPGVPARTLASYLRTLPRVGVGVYTHPKTLFVHLDDRERSFHWLDASPPGRSWRELSLGGGVRLIKRDAAYARRDDWPENTSPPLDVAP